MAIFNLARVLHYLPAPRTLLLLLLVPVLISLTLEWVTVTLQLELSLAAVRQNWSADTDGPFNPLDTMEELPVTSISLKQTLHFPNGKHAVLDFYGIEDSGLAFLETEEGEEWVGKQIDLSGMTHLGNSYHLFPGGGMSAIFLLAESHMSIHTWPEHSFAALDIYTCGNSSSLDHLVDSMFRMLKPTSAKVSFVDRGSEVNHSIHVDHFSMSNRLNSSSNPPPTATSLILTGTDRPEFSMLPAVVDICVNAGFPGDECFLWRNASLLYSQWSTFQLVEVVHRQSDELCLLLDGIVQFCDSSDNDIYSKALTDTAIQPYLRTIPPTPGIDVYVVGGGDGWIASYLLATFPSLIQTIHVIDIDPQVTHITRQFFSTLVGANSSFMDPRVKWINGDASVWFRDAPDDIADAVIIDCTDHTQGPSEVLYTQDFYSNVSRVLRPGARFSQQMNTVDDDYDEWRARIRESWLQLGFEDLLEWKAAVKSYGDFTVMMGGMKSRRS